MKKNIFYLAIVIMGIVQVQSIQAQILGKWILPTTKTYSDNTCELIFTENGITNNPISLSPLYDVPTEFSAGAYNSNYDTEFYVIGENIYYNGVQYPWATSLVPLMFPEFQIIQKPGNPNKYLSFYTLPNYSSLREDATYFNYNEITIENGQIDISGHNEIRGGIVSDDFVGFAISPEESSPRYLYVSTSRKSTLNTDEAQAGLRRYVINSDEIIFDQVIINQLHQSLNEYDFDAYNLELNYYNSSQTIIAWTNGIENSYTGQTVDRIIIVKDNSPKIYDLNYGRIGGIEFSSLEENVLYASCTNIGIVKVDYTDFNNPIYTTIQNSSNYAHTFLETAPDGHIYGVLTMERNYVE